ncbi:MAG: hypothetical protein LRY71_06975 [Bacillaceae bacterium]|nr:hypothetical protein [Bacillaceae bacterium]
MKKKKVVAQGQNYEVKLSDKEARVGVVEDIFVTVPKTEDEAANYDIEILIDEASPSELLHVGDRLGILIIRRGEEIVGEGKLQLLEIEEGYEETVEELAVVESLQSNRSLITFLHPHGWILLFLLLAARWIHGLRRNRRYRKSVSRHFP